MQEPDMTMNFMMLLNSGTQRRPAKVMYSTDFDGTMTQEGFSPPHGPMFPTGST